MENLQNTEANTSNKTGTSKKRVVIIAFIAFFSIFSYGTYRYFSASKATIHYTAYAPKVVKGKLITLQLLKEEHFLDYHNMFSDIVRKNLEFPKHITLGYTIAYLRQEMKKTARGEQLLYMIFDNKDHKLIGGIEIREKNDKDPGQLGCWVNENYWGGGRFQEALHLINKVYFTLKPKAQSYTAQVRLWNNRSYYSLKKYGLEDAGYFYENGRPARYILKMKRSKVDWKR